MADSFEQCGQVGIDAALASVTADKFDGHFAPLGRGSLSAAKPLLAGAFVYPLDRDPQYRGWYPIDSGPDRGKSRWYPDQSKFNGRGGNHEGADLWGIHKDKVYAATKGNIEYNVINDPNGWGNHVYLYFKFNSETYIAVYAHLDPSSKFEGTRTVAAGEVIAYLGCTGNAGGTCDRSHKCGGKTTIADHVHVEVLKVKDKTKHDPISFFGWAPEYGNVATSIVCGSQDQTT